MAWVVVGACGAIGAGCDGRAPAGGPPAAARVVTVSLAPVARRSVPRTVEVTGTLYGEEEATISAKVGGRVVALDADLGDVVEPGERLALIDPTDYRLALTERTAAFRASLARLGLTDLPDETFDVSSLPTVLRARAEEANALARYERARRLFESDPPLLSPQDFADIETQWRVASQSAGAALLEARAILAEARTQAASLATAEQRLADTAVRVPEPPGPRSYVYRVGERRASIGELVTPGQALFRVVSSERVKFRGAVPQSLVGRVQTGQEVILEVDGLPGTARGTVTRVAPQIDVATRSFDVEIEAENADGRLKPGSFGRARIVTTVEDGVPFVPRSAVITFAGVQKVFGVADGKAVEVRTRTGVVEGDSVELIGPLPLTEVVVEGAGGLANGVPVQVGAPPGGQTGAPGRPS